jgi:predicted O-methyltransferase YrrM
MDEVDRLLGEVKERASGWMPLPVYRRLYETAAACGGGDIVEIGTYRGAATIALALGAKTSGKAFRIFTADLLRPGIGPVGSTLEAKTAELRSTFEAFGVGDVIEFVHGSSADLLMAANPRHIRLLLLDAGGRIEADLAQLWDRIAPSCPIVIDDIDGHTYVRRNRRKAVVDQKHRISQLLADRFVAAGLLVPCGITAATGWYRKGEAAASAAEIERMALPAYHELIKVTIDADEFGPLRAMLRRVAARAPWLAGAFRRLRPAPTD